METKALSDALSEIQRLMDGEAELDEQDRALLARLHDQVGVLLAQPTSERRAEDRETLVDLMREGVDHFESDHPRLLEAAGRLAEILSGMGI